MRVTVAAGELMAIVEALESASTSNLSGISWKSGCGGDCIAPDDPGYQK